MLRNKRYNDNSALKLFGLSLVKFFLLAFLLQSCSSNEPYLYDRPGVERTTGRPAGYGQGYRTSPVGYTPAPTYYYSPYAAPTPIPGYGSAQQPAASRYYSNPYDIQQPQRATPYYDSDQYYVPPTYYYNNSEQSSGANTKM